jgi:hypothetical protein
MRHFRLMSIFALALVAALWAPASLARDPGAQAFLRSVYAPYEKAARWNDLSSEAKAARYFVPALTNLIAEALADAKARKRVGRLDFDPFIGDQDWQATKIAVKVEPGASADRATGTARFTLEGDREPSVVTLDLVKTPAGWRIAEIRWSWRKDSLVAALSKKD